MGRIRDGGSNPNSVEEEEKKEEEDENNEVNLKKQ